MPVIPSIDDFSAQSFDHGVDRFHLPTLAVATLRKMTFHLFPISTCWLGNRRSAVGWRYQRLDLQLVASQLMVRFAVETGVGQNCSWLDVVMCLSKQGFEVSKVWIRTLGCSRGYDQMALGVANDPKLGKAAIGNTLCFSSLFARFASLREIAAGVLRLESAGIDRSQLGTLPQDFSSLGTPDRCVEQSRKLWRHQQPMRRFLQCCKVWHLLQTDHGSKRIGILKQLCDCAVGKIVKIFQHQTGEQLMLCEHLGAADMRVFRQRSLSNAKRLGQHLLGTLRCLHITLDDQTLHNVSASKCPFG